MTSIKEGLLSKMFKKKEKGPSPERLEKIANFKEGFHHGYTGKPHKEVERYPADKIDSDRAHMPVKEVDRHYSEGYYEGSSARKQLTKSGNYDASEAKMWAHATARDEYGSDADHLKEMKENVVNKEILEAVRTAMKKSTIEETYRGKVIGGAIGAAAAAVPLAVAAFHHPVVAALGYPAGFGAAAVGGAIGDKISNTIPQLKHFVSKKVKAWHDNAHKNIKEETARKSFINYTKQK